jgi:hypothetical protein
VVIASVALGCAAPSRHLTNRQVEDPIVHPRGLASVAASGTYTSASIARDATALDLVIRYGITDRLELRNLSLGYAFLDDAPSPDGRKRDPLALMLRAGVEGFGWSSIDGAILIPTLVLAARKHLGTRLYLWGDLGWTAWWASSPGQRPYPYNAWLWPGGNSSRVVASAGGLVQLVDRVALSLGGHADQLRACVFTSCDVTSRALMGFAGVWFRPLRWMDVSVFGTLGHRQRVAPPVVPAPADPADVPPDTVTWQAVSLTLAFRW